MNCGYPLIQLRPVQLIILEGCQGWWMPLEILLHKGTVLPKRPIISDFHIVGSRLSRVLQNVVVEIHEVEEAGQSVIGAAMLCRIQVLRVCFI
jgi:hypothetical protein